MTFEALFSAEVEDPKPSSNGWMNSWCPFHEKPRDGHKTPSFGFDPDTGGWKCHGCGKGGGPVDFLGYIEILGYDPSNRDQRRKARELLCEKIPSYQPTTPSVIGKMEKSAPRTMPLPGPEKIDKYHRDLLEDTEMLDHLVNERLWSEEVIKKLRIGKMSSHGGSRYTIPISQGGELVNVRKYNSKLSPKMMGIKGRNSAYIFPEFPLEKERLYLVEGEPDCIAALSIGLNAITFTAGAGSLPKDLHRLKDHKIVILYDNDDAGREGAKKVLAAVQKFTSQVKILDLYDICDKSNDSTDAILNLGSSEFLRLLKESASRMPAEAVAPLNTIIKKEVGFNEAIASGHIGTKIEVVAMVLGRRERPYSATSKLSSKCKSVGLKPFCSLCPLSSGSCETPASPNEFICERDLLKQIKVGDAARRAVLRETGGFLCDEWEIDDYKSKNESLFEVVIGPYHDSSAEQEHIGFQQRTAFAIDEGGGHSINQPYRFTGVTVAQPWDQANTHVFTKCSEIQRSVDCFSLTEGRIEKLDIFCV